MSYTSVIGNISNMIRDLSNIILFEFSKYNTEKGDSEFLYLAVLYTLPTEINYTYSSRNRFIQTKSGGFLDKFPMGLPKIRISGTFGKERRGLLYLDGLTRLRIFKELVKYYHISDPIESKIGGPIDKLLSKIKAIDANMVKDRYELKDNEVYVMTMYDFINSEIWIIDPTTLDIYESATTQANLPRYDLKMQAIGKPLGTKIDNILEKTLLVRDAMLAVGGLMGTIALPERFNNQIKPLWQKFTSGFRA